MFLHCTTPFLHCHSLFASLLFLHSALTSFCQGLQPSDSLSICGSFTYSTSHEYCPCLHPSLSVCLSPFSSHTTIWQGHKQNMLRFFCFVLIENQTCSLEISFCQTNKHVSISLGAFFFTNSKSTAVFSTEM